MFADPYKDTASSLSSPAADCFEIDPHNSADLTSATKAIYIGTGGDLVLRPVGSDNDVTFVNVPGGSILPVRVQAVRINGTTASDIVGLV